MIRLSTSFLQLIGRSNRGPSPSEKYNPKPIASGIVKISENRIAASKSKRRKGCKVTSHAKSALRHKDMKSPA